MISKEEKAARRAALALAKKVREAATAAAPAPTIFPPEVTLRRLRPLRIVQIGAGGTGARIATGVVKLLGKGDHYVIRDGDVVEQKNLARQHFIESDIGRPKAEAVAERAVVASPPGVVVESIPRMLENYTINGVLESDVAIATTAPVIIIGAVDNIMARAGLRGVFNNRLGPTAYIDAGNELRGGQVILSVSKWPGTVSTASFPAISLSQINFNAMSVFPALFEGKEKPKVDTEADACAIRIDAQSLAANQMAAALVINIFSWLIDEIPFFNAGGFFSTLGSIRPLMLTAPETQPPLGGTTKLGVAG